MEKLKLLFLYEVAISKISKQQDQQESLKMRICMFWTLILK